MTGDHGHEPEIENMRWWAEGSEPDANAVLLGVRESRAVMLTHQQLLAIGLPADADLRDYAVIGPDGPLPRYADQRQLAFQAATIANPYSHLTYFQVLAEPAAIIDQPALPTDARAAESARGYDSTAALETPVDVLLIVHPMLKDAAGPVADALAHEGKQVLTRDTDSLYRQFGAAQPSVDALRNAIAHYYLVGARQVVIVGSAQIDRAGGLVPSGVVIDPTTGSRFATDQPLADLDGDGVTDLSLTRLPVRQAAELRAAVASTLAAQSN